MQKQWFETWFDSKYYHILYRHRDDTEAQLFMDNISNYLKIIPGSRIIDVACGKGRHSIYLNKKGFDITGVDLSTQSIFHAKKFENETLHFAVQDMRETYKKNSFDFVFNLFTSFGYFDETGNLQAIQSMKEMLTKEGIIVIDFLNSTKTINNLVVEETKVLDGISFYITREYSDGFIIKNIDFKDDGHCYSFQEKVKAISLEKFQEYFDKNNLELMQTFGNFNLETYQAESSDRLIMILKNKN